MVLVPLTTFPRSRGLAGSVWGLKGEARHMLYPLVAQRGGCACSTWFSGRSSLSPCTSSSSLHVRQGNDCFVYTGCKGNMSKRWSLRVGRRCGELLRLGAPGDALADTVTQRVRALRS